jgi:hypothetical protein
MSSGSLISCSGPVPDMTVALDILDARMERLITLLRDASGEERRCLKCAIKAVAQAREALFQAHQRQQNAWARLMIARTITRRAEADTARLKAQLQIILDRSPK